VDKACEFFIEYRSQGVGNDEAVVLILPQVARMFSRLSKFGRRIVKKEQERSQMISKLFSRCVLVAILSCILAIDFSFGQTGTAKSPAKETTTASQSAAAGKKVPAKKSSQTAKTAGKTAGTTKTAKTGRTAKSPTTPKTAGAGKTSQVAKKAPTKTKKPVASRARSVRKPKKSSLANSSVLWARAGVLFDVSDGKILFEKNAEKSYPIASITKLVTALTFLDREVDLDKVTTMERDDIRGSRKTRLRVGERVSLIDLLHASLICSDNAATKALARESGLGLDEFVNKMNEKASELGLDGAHFVDPTGLNAGNVASALGCVKLIKAATENELLAGIMQTKSYYYETNIRGHQIANTNRLLHSDWDILGGKTGFIHASGYCLTTYLLAKGKEVAVVILGAPSNGRRFREARLLLERHLKIG
jgi:D-alanyl-D-alanine endopeptidase (penicillin-binding protein 7)